MLSMNGSRISADESVLATFARLKLQINRACCAGNPLIAGKCVGLKKNSRAVRVKLQVPFDFAQGRLSPTLPRISCSGNPGLSVGMTKLRAVTHLGMSGGGWTE